MASAKDHKERGNAFYTREEFAAAIKCYDAAIALEPASPALFTNRSAAHFASGDYERSLADANAATALDIKWTKGHYRAGAALVELERYDDAIAAYSRGRDADPSNARVKVGLETAERLKREAPADWRDAKSRGAYYVVSYRIVSDVCRPTWRFGVFSFAFTLTRHQFLHRLVQSGNDAYRAGAYEDAIRWYGKGLKLLAAETVESGADHDEARATLLTNRAECNRQLCEIKAVIIDCDEALRLSPKNVKALLRRGLAFEYMEKNDLAAADFKNALLLDAKNAVASEGLRRVAAFKDVMGLPEDAEEKKSVTA
jgi:tetratricopeptide (TPR) repeat protein